MGRDVRMVFDGVRCTEFLVDGVDIRSVVHRAWIKINALELPQVVVEFIPESIAVDLAGAEVGRGTPDDEKGK